MEPVITTVSTNLSPIPFQLHFSLFFPSFRWLSSAELHTPVSSPTFYHLSSVPSVKLKILSKRDRVRKTPHTTPHTLHLPPVITDRPKHQPDRKVHTSETWRPEVHRGKQTASSNSTLNNCKSRSGQYLTHSYVITAFFKNKTCANRQSCTFNKMSWSENTN